MKLELGSRTQRQLEQIRWQPSGSYLFFGPIGTGKYSAARALADQTVADPRNVLVVENEKLSLGIDLIHNLNYQLQLKATRGHRYAIIRSAEKMTTEAQNAFLKTLEEPPLDTTIILTASDRTKLLPTIISRCQLVGFEPIAQPRVEDYLSRKHGLNKQQSAQLAELTDGALGRAINLASDEEARQRWLATEQAVEVLGDPARDSYQKLQAVARAGIEPRLLIERLITRLRQQIKAAADNRELLANLHPKLSQVEASWRYLAANVNPKLVLAQLSLEMAA